MRFRTEQHLRRQRDFLAVREQGRRINCGAFTLWCLKRESASDLGLIIDKHPLSTAAKRVGVVASNASVGHAVLRNRAKRRLRELFRRHQDLVPAGCDLLMTARNAATTWPDAQLEQKFAEACRQLSSSRPS